MSLGFELYEDNRSFEQEGLTGTVKRYTTTDMEFPCYIIDADNIPVKGSSIKTLRMMFPTSKVLDEDLANSMITIYFSQGDQKARLGRIQPNQVKTFLRLFQDNEIIGFLDKDTMLTDKYLYVLSN